MAEHRQVVYNLATWSPNQRGELVAMLTGSGISHDWRSATTLVVVDLVEAEVDGMISSVHGASTLVTDESGTKWPEDPAALAGRPAPLVLRAIAFLMDSIVTSVAWWIALGSSLDGTSAPLAGRAVGTAILAAYHVGFVALYGQTPGKMAVRLRIVDEATGEPPGPLRAAVRFAVPNLVWVASLSVGLSGPADQVWSALVYGWVIIDKRRRGLHDLAAGTLVVRRQPVG